MPYSNSVKRGEKSIVLKPTVAKHRRYGTSMKMELDSHEMLFSLKSALQHST